MAQSPGLDPNRVEGSDPVILVAEDNEMNYELISAALELDGFEIRWARDGQETLSAVTSDRLDLLVLDLHLPKVSGIDVLRQVRAAPATAELPVLVLTADAMAGTRDTVMAEGATEFITKPYDLKDLRSAIARLLR